MANTRRAHADEAWTNAKKICRLNARQVEMARVLGMNPKKLPGLHPTAQGPRRGGPGLHPASTPRRKVRAVGAPACARARSSAGRFLLASS